MLQTIILGEIAGDFLQLWSELLVQAKPRSRRIGTYSNRGDVRKVGSDTGSVHNIVQGKLINQRASLQEERERLF